MPAVSSAVTAALFSSLHSPGYVNTTTGSTVVVGVVVCEDVPVVVPDDVGVLVIVLVGVDVALDVGVVVGVLVTVVEVGVVDVVGVEVAVEVGVLLAVVVVVGVVVGVVEGDVVGVVTSHVWYPPAWYASVMAFSVAAVASHSSPSARYSENAQPTAVAAPSGPRNSRAAKLMAFAVSAQLAPPPLSTSAAYVSPSSSASSHSTVPGLTARSVPANTPAHVATKSLSATACAAQLWVPST